MSGKVKVEFGFDRSPLVNIISDQCEYLVTEYIRNYIKPSYIQDTPHKKIDKIIKNCNEFYACVSNDEDNNKIIHALITLEHINIVPYDITISALIGNPTYFHILIRRTKVYAKNHGTYNLYTYIPESEEIYNIFTSEEFIEVERFHDPDTKKVFRIKMMCKIEQYILEPYALKPGFF